MTESEPSRRDKVGRMVVRVGAGIAVFALLSAFVALVLLLIAVLHGRPSH
jgi:hypothetical protein